MNRVLKHFLMLQMIDEAATYSNGKLASLASQTVPRLCKDAMLEQVGYLFSLEYGRHYVSEQRRSSVLKMFDEIRFELDSLLLQLDWPDSKTKKRASNKLANVRALVAYPDHFLNATFLNSISGISETFNFEPDSYLSNVLSLRRAEFLYDASLVHTSYRDLAWIRFKDSTNAYSFYEDSFNSINILAGQLNDQIYDETRPKYLNYAIIGSIIGHELMHAFDARGIRLDEKGDWRIWWDIDSESAYRERLNCFRQLYDGLSLPGEPFFKINGSKTLNENLADLVGLRLAYRAYVRNNNDAKDNLRLAAFEQFNGAQMFWLSYGANWCSGLSPSQMEKRYRDDVHSPEPLRVNVPLQNLAEFANDFNCPIGSKMNPAPKRVQCELF